MLSDEALVEARQASLQLSASQADEGESVDSTNAARDHPNQTSAPHPPPESRGSEQDSRQVSNSDRSAGNQMVLMPDTNFVGMPSPRWAGNASEQVRAKFPYTAKLPDELSLSVGDIVHVTGKPCGCLYVSALRMHFLAHHLWPYSLQASRPMVGTGAMPMALKVCFLPTL